MHSLLQRIQSLFQAAFGETKLEDRTRDIQKQANSVAKHNDLADLRHEVGDLLSSTLQLCIECGWEPTELVSETLDRIEGRLAVYQKLNRKKKVGILRNDFDPIHNQHLAIIQTVLQSEQVDEVWLMPSYIPKRQSGAASAKDRLAMARLATQGMERVHVFNYEIEKEFEGDLYHLVKKLLGEREFRDRVEFSLIVKRSLAEEYHRASSSEKLDESIPFLIIDSKTGAAPKQNSWCDSPPHRSLKLEVDESTLASSAEIVGLLERDDKSVWKFVPKEIAPYIRDHGLYSPKPTITQRDRIAVFSDSFCPPTLLQREHIQQLLDHGFDRVIIHPRGVRPDRGEHEFALPKHRAAMVSLAFSDLPGTEINYDDISLGVSSPLLDLTYQYQSQGDVWLVVREADVLRAGPTSSAPIEQMEYGERLWNESKFVVLSDSSVDSNGPSRKDLLPPHHHAIRVRRGPTGSEIRSSIFEGGNPRDFRLPLREQVDRDVADYIERHRLFLPGTLGRDNIFKIDSPQLAIIYDERNAKATQIAQMYTRFESKNPNLILVVGGDGTMLKAIRDHWRKRLPFLGLNAGHLGFLMNASLPGDLSGIELISQSLPLLRVDVRYPDGRSSMHLAYGDTWIERAEGQAAWLKVSVNGDTQIEKVVGDGMLIATAAGSSAYARAMGAVPVPLDSQSLVLAGSNIFQPRFWKPMNLPSTSRITLTSLDQSGKRPLRAFIDGQALGLVQEISARQSLTASVELAFTKEFDPSMKLLKSLFPSDVE